MRAMYIVFHFFSGTKFELRYDPKSQCWKDTYWPLIKAIETNAKETFTHWTIELL